MVGELKDGQIREYDIHPEDFGMSMFSNRGLKVEDPHESRIMVLEALENREGTPREIVILNAAAALYAANVVDSIEAGLIRAREAVVSGAARAKLDEFVAATRSFAA
jgi:anthranilate phosphoribosyltransferase